MSEATYSVKPGYHKGGKGRFTRMASPCEFGIGPDTAPELHVHYCPPSNGWLALLATIITAIIVQVVAQATGFMVGPGLIIWYLIINAIRRRKVDIDLTQVERIVTDDRKNEISILGNIVGKDTWIGLKCRDQFRPIIDALNASGQVSLEQGKMVSSQMGMTILLVVLLALIALFMIAVAISM